MKGQPIEYKEFVLHPEYWEGTLYDLQKASRNDDKYHVAANKFKLMNRVYVCHDGCVVYERPKFRLHPSEENSGLLRGNFLPTSISINGKQVLILICYEIMFPDDYLLQNMGKTDLVLHLVGQPMFNEDQREGWVAMQRAVFLTYFCPIVCCCGGEEGRMNISGLTTI